MAKQRKCAICDKELNTKNKNSLGHILRYKGKYYHTECFIEFAKSRVAKNNSYSASWQNAINSIDALIEDARLAITVKVKTDPLNDYLLINYDVGSLSSRFWSIISDIGNGVYKHKKCKPIDCDMLLDMWKYYQNELNNINKWNKSKGNNIDGEGRANYDLAILMGKYNEYKKIKAKLEAEEAERQLRQKESVKIDYSKIKSERKSNGLDDISDLLDDIF
jgi:hypothetical protein